MDLQGCEFRLRMWPVQCTHVKVTGGMPWMTAGLRSLLQLQGTLGSSLVQPIIHGSMHRRFLSCLKMVVLISVITELDSRSSIHLGSRRLVRVFFFGPRCLLEMGLWTHKSLQ